MCDPISAAISGATALGGAYLNNRAASRAAASNQAAVDRQTEMSKEEYNTRRRLSNETFDRSFDRSRGQYDFRTTTEDERSARIRDVNTTEENRRLTAETDDIDRRKASDLEAIGGRRAATNEAFDERAASRTGYNALLDAESGRQRGFQAAADATVDAGIDEFRAPKAEAVRSTGAAARDASIGSAVSTAASPSVSSTLSDLTQRAIRDEVGKKRGEAAARSAAGAQVASYGDLIASGDQALKKLGIDLGAISTKADISRQPLDTELGAAQRRFANAGERADDRVGAVAEDAAARTRMSEMLKRAVVNPSLQRQSATTENIGATGDKIINSSGDYETSAGAADDRYLGTVNQSSSTYENVIRGLTDARIRSTPTTSPLGPLLQQLSSFGFNLSTNPTTRTSNWLSSSFSRPGSSGP